MTVDVDGDLGHRRLLGGRVGGVRESQIHARRSVGVAHNGSISLTLSMSASNTGPIVVICSGG